MGKKLSKKCGMKRISIKAMGPEEKEETYSRFKNAIIKTKRGNGKHINQEGKKEEGCGVCKQRDASEIVPHIGKGNLGGREVNWEQFRGGKLAKRRGGNLNASTKKTYERQILEIRAVSLRRKL